MAQIIATKGRIKKAKIAKIIHKKKIETSIFLIFANKNKPKATRKVMISPLVK